jgi:hypothetical protein
MLHTIPQAKNYIRKTLWKIVDKGPSAREIAALWAHFESQCAYCGVQLSRTGRKAHIDHLDANLSIACNHISNRVLACNICNGDEKRETNWEQFLNKKCGLDQAFYVVRHFKIMAWRNQWPVPVTTDEEIVAHVQHSVQVCNALLEEQAKRIRLLLASNLAQSKI